MPAQITMPQQSDTMTEGTVVKWLKREGDKIKAGEIIAEIETDKAVMEMESFDAGTLAHIAVAEGGKVPVGAVLGLIATGAEKPEDIKRSAGSAAAPNPAPAAAAAPAKAGATPAAPPASDKPAAAPAMAVPAPASAITPASAPAFKSTPGKYEYDILVIGGGPAGYAAAIRAGQLKKKVLCVEKENLGGTCLNWGCIPTKALLDDGAFIRKLRTEADKHGVSFDNLKIDFTKLIQRSRGIANDLSKGIAFLFSKAGVKSEVGTAQLLGPHRVRIAGKEGTKEVTADHIIIATVLARRRCPGLCSTGKR